eukprot:924129-Ditylum_brightwellii.AAC.1
MMECVDVEDSTSDSISTNRGYAVDYLPAAISDKFHVKWPWCIVCSMEESMNGKVYKGNKH